MNFISKVPFDFYVKTVLITQTRGVAATVMTRVKCTCGINAREKALALL